MLENMPFRQCLPLRYTRVKREIENEYRVAKNMYKTDASNIEDFCPWYREVCYKARLEEE